MQEKAETIFDEIRDTWRYPLEIRYLKLYNLLKRLCIDASCDLHADFSGLFSRLYAVCRHYRIDYHPADRFRRRSRRILAHEEAPEEASFRADAGDLAVFVAALYGEEVPEDLQISAVTVKKKYPRSETAFDKLRVLVTSVGKDVFTCVPAATPQAEEMTVDASRHPGLTDLLENAVQLNLLDVEKHGEAFTATYIIYEPDFLVDVSSLTACYRPFGSHPYNYLLAKFEPRRTTRPILLGNAANGFMDDCINETDATPADFVTSIRRHFHDSMLEYACTSDEIDASYFADAKLHFDNIRTTVQERLSSPEIGIMPEAVLLEPTFICEALGLRGRLDVMTADHLRLVELKSGRADDFRRPEPRPREEHVLQMALYKEILHYNFGIPYDKISAFLFYSRYPVFFDERTPAAAIKRVLTLRNAIVHQERRLAGGGFRSMLPTFTEETINENQLDNKLYHNYLLPSIRAVVEPLQKMDSLEAEYFSAFLTFLEREQFAAKTNDNRPDSNRSFANLWSADVPSKMAAGDILPGLLLRETNDAETQETLVFSLPDYGNDFVPNFAPGEMVLLYERPDEQANVTNRQLFRAYVHKLSENELTLSLLYKQKNKHVFLAGKSFAIEHDSTDVVFAQNYRSLHALLTATPRRRDLLLGRRQPETNPSSPLLSQYDEPLAKVISRAMSATDYYILVGPPGTGKTSVYIRGMVEEFLRQRAASAGGQAALLLSAYTNRAVDELCAMLEAIELPFYYVRIGAEQTCHPRFRSRLLSQAENLQTRRDVRRFLVDAPVVIGTVATLTSHLELFSLKPFDMAIFDEASQMLEPQLLGLLTARYGQEDAIRRFVMVGDHKQLPAVVQLAPSETRVESARLHEIGLFDLRNSLFERLHYLLQKWNRHELVDEPDRQGRMHADICAFASRFFYDGRLKPVPLAHQTDRLPFSRYETPLEAFAATTRMGFIDVDAPAYVANNKCNENEAEVAAALVAALLALHCKNGLPTDDLANRVGIIVPFRNQIASIRRAVERCCPAPLADMTIDTVECFQGSQRDIIIFSTTVSSPYQLDLISTCRPVDGSLVDRKLNVALTRARLQLFVVGNGRLLARNALYAKLIAGCKRFDGNGLLRG